MREQVIAALQEMRRKMEMIDQYSFTDDIDACISLLEGEPVTTRPDAAVNEAVTDELVRIIEGKQQAIVEPSRRLSATLPGDMKSVLWVPIGANGAEYWQCCVDGFGKQASAISRNKGKALGYALEDLAQQVLESAA
jgi:hypothetical protein